VDNCWPSDDVNRVHAADGLRAAPCQWTRRATTLAIQDDGLAGSRLARPNIWRVSMVSRMTCLDRPIMEDTHSAALAALSIQRQDYGRFRCVPD
jgi:hypothetical protein